MDKYKELMHYSSELQAMSKVIQDMCSEVARSRRRFTQKNWDDLCTNIRRERRLLPENYVEAIIGNLEYRLLWLKKFNDFKEVYYIDVNDLLVVQGMINGAIRLIFSLALD